MTLDLQNPGYQEANTWDRKALETHVSNHQTNFIKRERNGSEF